MSNAIRYDPLLVRHLAAELRARFGGAPVREIRLDPERRAAGVTLEEGGLVWELHPTRGWPRTGAPPPAPEAAPLHHRATIGEITAPPDERLLFIDIDSPGSSVRQARRIVVELMTNQWNVLVLNRKGRILAPLWPRTAGGRVLRKGEPYEAPAPLERDAELDRDGWRALLADVPPAERPRTLVRSVAYTSPLNARAILGEAARSGEEPPASARAMAGAGTEPASGTAEPEDASALDAAYDRYRALVSATPPDPHVLEIDDRRQPYPFPLPGVPGEPAPSLLDAMAAVAGGPAPEAAPTPRIPPELLARLRRRIGQLEHRRQGLAEELEGAGPEAAELRRKADLLLSQLHEVRKGMERAELTDYAEGGTITVELDPALSPTDNADRLYDAAQKRERAAERLPVLMRRSERERKTLAALLERVERGEADAEEVEAAVGPAEEEQKAREPERLPPYRSYRTSGGREVRVGRNRQANDELTFHHSSPEDIWLHARDVPGSHVVLRWGDKNANPPKRDLLEAAVLAALNSKARTSGTVGVDWTRRKYVRKPSKAPPGLVVPFRDVSTVFVEPNEALERRMREAD